MFDRLYPDIYIESIEQLPLKEFKRRGIKAFVFDMHALVNSVHPLGVEQGRPALDAVHLISLVQ